MTSAKEGGVRRSQLLSLEIVNPHFFLRVLELTHASLQLSVIPRRYSKSSLTHAINTVGGGENLKRGSSIGATRLNLHSLPTSGLLDREERGGEKLELAAAAVAKSYSHSSGRLLPVSHVILQRSVISLNFRFFQRPGGGGGVEEEEEDTETKQQLRKTLFSSLRQTSEV